MNELFHYIDQRIPLTPALRAKLLSTMQYQECAKGSTLLAAGHVCHRIWFLQQGIVRSCLRTPEEDITNWIYIPFTVLYAGNSFIERTPSEESFQVLETVRLWYITREDLEQLFTEFPVTIELHHKIAAEYVSQLKSLAYVKGMASLEQRFTWLKTHFRDIIYTVEPVLLASFISISRRSFYNLKKKLGSR